MGGRAGVQINSSPIIFADGIEWSNTGSNIHEEKIIYFLNYNNNVFNVFTTIIKDEI